MSYWIKKERPVSKGKNAPPGFSGVVSGLRYYNPELGRWINRDPIEEVGGLNLLSFVLNDPIGLFDALGLKCVVDYYKYTYEISYSVTAFDFIKAKNIVWTIYKYGVAGLDLKPGPPSAIEMEGRKIPECWTRQAKIVKRTKPTWVKDPDAYKPVKHGDPTITKIVIQWTETTKYYYGPDPKKPLCCKNDTKPEECPISKKKPKKKP